MATAILPGHAQSSGMCTSFSFNSLMEADPTEANFVVSGITSGVADGTLVNIEMSSSNNEFIGPSEFATQVENEDSAGYGLFFAETSIAFNE